MFDLYLQMNFEFMRLLRLLFFLSRFLSHLDNKSEREEANKTVPAEIVSFFLLLLLLRSNFDHI